MISKKIFSNKRSEKYAINAGSPIKQLYKGEVGTDGIITLVKAGIKNIQDEINSFEKSTDLYNILARLTPEEIQMRADQMQDFSMLQVYRKLMLKRCSLLLMVKIILKLCQLKLSRDLTMILTSGLQQQEIKIGMKSMV